MPSWSEITQEINTYNTRNPIDDVRVKYLKKLHEYTNRNVIAYYSGWLQKPNVIQAGIDDNDKNAFMNAIYGLDKQIGLDLILHTPGGDLSAVESLIAYLRKIFGTNIRAIIPQIAMSAGTMIACACKEILMGKHSNLGPIDPQLNGLPASSVIAEFQQAIDEIKKDSAKIPLWQTIISKYHPTFLLECEHSINWASEMVQEHLRTGMFQDDIDKDDISHRIALKLSDHDKHKSHSRHIEAEQCKEIGLKIVDLEDDPELHDIVLSIHHCYMYAFSGSLSYKYIENHLGTRTILTDTPSR